MEAKLFVYEIDGETYVDVYNSVSELGAFFDEQGAASGSFKVYKLPFKIENTSKEKEENSKAFF